MKYNGNAVAIEVPGRNQIRRINIKAQHSAFSRAINRTVSYGLYMFIKSDVLRHLRHLQTRYKIHFRLDTLQTRYKTSSD